MKKDLDAAQDVVDALLREDLDDGANCYWMHSPIW